MSYPPITFHRNGIIPGPEEKEEAFCQRAHLLLSKNSSPSTSQIYEIFGLSPTWIEVHYSDKGLLPWQGGVTEIGETNSLQVRKALKNKRTILWIYSKEEIIAHEMVHMMRQKFDEKEFEEILAYQTSSNPLRRYIGPLFQNTRESTLFFLSFLCLFVPWGFLAPLALFSLGTLRLFKNQRLFSRCLRSLEKLVPSKKEALSWMLYLSDKEIRLFANYNRTELILEYAQAQHSPRWEQIRSVFLDTHSCLHNLD